MNKEQDRAFEELVALSQELGLYDHKEFDEKRFKANCWLLNTLAELVNEHKELRFGQILEAYGFVKTGEPHNDIYATWDRDIYVEPQFIAERVEKRIEELTK